MTETGFLIFMGILLLLVVIVVVVVVASSVAGTAAQLRMTTMRKNKYRKTAE